MAIRHTCDNARCDKLLPERHVTVWGPPPDDASPPTSHTFCNHRCLHVWTGEQLGAASSADAAPS